MGLLSNIRMGARFSNIYLVLEAVKKIKNWPIYFMDFFSLVRNRNIIYHTKNGIKYYVRGNSGDRAAITEVYLADAYKLNGLQLKNDDIAIDIGANIGAFSVLISKKVGAVYAYEPIPDNYRMLIENISLNNVFNIIKTSQCAIAGATGKLKIYLSCENSLSHSAYRASDSFIEVDALSLRDVFDYNNITSCALLKIDAEGAEYGILDSLPDDYYKRIKRIYLECHDLSSAGFDRYDVKYNANWLIGFLKNKGFSVRQSSVYIFAEK